MADWQNFYLQQMGTDPQGHEWPVKESVATWGIFCKDIPFKMAEKVKTPAKRTWLDEHGDDEYIGPDGLYMEAYTMEIELGCKLMNSDKAATYGKSEAVNDVKESIATFINWLRTAGMMKVYSSHTRIGRQLVRLESVKDKAKWKTVGEWKTVNGARRRIVTEEWLVFSIELKVNDPVTEIAPSGNSLGTVTG